MILHNKTVLFVLTNSALNRGMNTGLENLAWGLAERGVRVHILTGGSEPKNHGYSLPEAASYHFTGQSGDCPTNFLSLFDHIVREHQVGVVVGWIINTALLAQSPTAKGVRFIANLGQMPPRSVFLRFLKQVLLGKMRFTDACRLISAISKYPAIVDTVVSISQSVQAASISKYKLKSQSCMIIPRGIDIEIYTFNLRERDIEDPVEVLFAGNVQDSKGVGDLVRALCLVHTPVVLRLCGPADKEYIMQLKNLLEITKHKVEHMGAIGQLELSDFYRQCDIFIFPSHAEGLGKALLEAMACGCPIVCSDISTFKEVVQNEINGLMVSVRSPEALAKAIDRLIADRTLRKNFSQNARKTIEMNFTKRAEIDSWLKILQGSAK